MTYEFTGRVLFANGQPAANVQVRVFDKEAPGMVDEDLTVEEGLSDENGRFSVYYKPSRHLDWEGPEDISGGVPFDWTPEARHRDLPQFTDAYLPYLQFRYNLYGQPRTHTTFLRPFKYVFRLTEVPPVTFLPSQQGFRFKNPAVDYPLPISIAALPQLDHVKQAYGLCGGMVAAAYDFVLAGHSIPETTETPTADSPLYRYLYRRQIDSFGPFGQEIVRTARWMVLPEEEIHGIQKQTHDQFEIIHNQLDDGGLVPLTLIYTQTDLWQNHQVLAYGFTEWADGKLDINVYHPNYPLRDDIYLRCEPISMGNRKVTGALILGLKSALWIGDQEEKMVYGFFAVPYIPIHPPAHLSSG